MVGLLFNLAGFSSITKSVWLMPLFIFILLLVTRMASLFLPNMYSLYFIYYSCFFISIILSVAFMAGSLKALFRSGYDLKSQVIFYKKLGVGTLNQYFIKLFIVVGSTLLVWTLCSVIMWHFSNRLLIALALVYSILLMFRTACVVFKTSLVYYVGVIIIVLSFFYPVYVLPNPAYVFKGAITDVASYSFVYMLLYVTVGYKFFISSWRNECIGWMF